MIKIISRVSPQVAGEILNLSVQSVQGALIANALPIGGAWKNPGSSTYTYYISAQKLAEFVGITKQEVLERCENS